MADNSLTARADPSPHAGLASLDTLHELGAKRLRRPTDIVRAFSEVKLRSGSLFRDRPKLMNRSPTQLKRRAKIRSLPKMSLESKRGKASGVLKNGKLATLSTEAQSRYRATSLSNTKSSEGSFALTFKRLPKLNVPSFSLDLTSLATHSNERSTAELSTRKLESVITDCSKFGRGASKLSCQLSQLQSRLKNRFKAVKEQSELTDQGFKRSYIEGFMKSFHQHKRAFIYGKRFRGEFLTNLKAS
jgi:hypothetical protein